MGWAESEDGFRVPARWYIWPASLPHLESGSDLWIWGAVTPLIRLCFVRLCCYSLEGDSPAGSKKQLSYCDRELGLEAESFYWELGLEAESSPQELQSYSCKRLNSTNNLMSLEEDPESQMEHSLNPYLGRIFVRGWAENPAYGVCELLTNRYCEVVSGYGFKALNSNLLCSNKKLTWSDFLSYIPFTSLLPWCDGNSSRRL